MNGDRRTAQDADGDPVGQLPAGPRTVDLRSSRAVSDDSRIAVEVRRPRRTRRDGRGARPVRRARHASTSAGPRGSRIQYLRDVAEADEAVQDALRQGVLTDHRRIARRGPSKSGSHEFSSTAAWIGGRPARAAIAGLSAVGSRRRTRLERRWPAPTGDPERQALARERRARLAAAIDRLDGRQRTVFMLCHFGDCTPREVSAMTGLNESTVRVHLFRAARKLRALLGGKLVMRRALHLQDDRLFDCYLAQRQGEAARSADRGAPGRLRQLRGAATPSWCCSWTACAPRAMPRPTRPLRPNGFAPSSSRSRDACEAVGRPARVLSFPGRSRAGHDRASTLRSPRWTAAAAAARLFLGIALGATYEWDSHPRPSAPAISARAAVPNPDIAADADFMSELELALDRPAHARVGGIRRVHAPLPRNPRHAVDGAGAECSSALGRSAHRTLSTYRPVTQHRAPSTQT